MRHKHAIIAACCYPYRLQGLETAFTDALKRIAQRDYLCPWFFPRLPDYSALLERHSLTIRAACYYERLTLL